MLSVKVLSYSLPQVSHRAMEFTPLFAVVVPRGLLRTEKPARFAGASATHPRGAPRPHPAGRPVGLTGGGAGGWCVAPPPSPGFPLLFFFFVFVASFFFLAVFV